jgi:hypothetical protein
MKCAQCTKLSQKTFNTILWTYKGDLICNEYCECSRLRLCVVASAFYWFLLHVNLHHSVTRDESVLLQKRCAEFYFMNMSISGRLQNCFSLIDKSKTLFITYCNWIKCNDILAATKISKVKPNATFILVYPTIYRFADSMSNRTVGWLMKNELGRIWKEVIVTYFFRKLCRGLSQISGETHRGLSHHNRRVGRDSGI